MVAPERTSSPILHRLELLMAERGEDIARWFEHEFAAAPALPYSSVDVRHAGFKLAPVDTNLFPAGFNNLSSAARGRAAAGFADWFRTHHPEVRKVLLLPENHTRNLGYLDNVATLLELFTEAGLDVRLGSLMEDLAEGMDLPTLTGRNVHLEPVRRVADALQLADGWQADLIFLNNDLTAGIPTLLEGLRQPITPPPARGWFARKKSIHFASYASVVERFASTFELDPWLLSAKTLHCGQVNFKERTGLEEVAKAVDEVLHATRLAYAQHGIADAPYAYVKADSGTYGMGIMTVTSGAELLEINKKTRNKMNVVKEGAQVSEVVVQEGVPTIDTIAGAPAEPVIYLVGGHEVGGAYRVNDARDALTNLNATGMRFSGMCDPFEAGQELGKVSVAQCHFQIFGLVARLATLAAALE